VEMALQNGVTMTQCHNVAVRAKAEKETYLNNEFFRIRQ
jgi:hypothetical protein